MRSPVKSPCSPIKTKNLIAEKILKSKETTLLNETALNGSMRKADSCISLVMRPVLFGNNFDSIEEIQFFNFMSRKKSMTIQTNNQRSLNDYDSLSQGLKTNTATNTLNKKEFKSNHFEKD